ncbi:hypothetical protein GH714_016026 [Hevea brasiliensis]|uniref:Uncharacterized protein n=1 Tax=Hevea brasiliensis TaxID=3981 RepID=A0A6A6KS56_HEVBR|nr:hypothetical protein GH714_016026 [Hevea brasiliensis]
MEVKKYGIRLVYDQDENEYNLMAGESSHPCDNLGLFNQVLDEPIMVDEHSKLERSHHDCNMAGPSKGGRFDLEEEPFCVYRNSRLKEDLVESEAFSNGLHRARATEKGV